MRDLGSPTIPYLPDDNVDRGNLVDGDDPDLAMDIEELFHKIFHGGFSTVWLAQDLKNQRNCAIKIMVSGPFGEHDCQMQTAIRDSVAGISHIVLYEVVFLLRGPQYNHYTFVFPFLGPDVESLVANQLHIVTRMHGAKQLLQVLESLHKAGFIHRAARCLFAGQNLQLRESATVPFWEDILNVYLTKDTKLTVNSQQPLDDSTKAVDVVVRYFEKGTFRNIFLLVLECKRANKKTAGLHELESQLLDFVCDFFGPDGSARRGLLFGGVAFGPKIRLYRCQKRQQRYVDVSPFWGGHNEVHEKYYKDAANDRDAVEILEAFKEMKHSIVDVA
ncbi:hypothetical protein LOZ61_000106 [Ophidiomyces ophidiicola]|nr:hypothetical protein LOZ61_000106 [Ophidiomyces ophidiicola]KAI1969121.1 hypothetical protein LOZ59_000148 [Ophidiomyces ophidiicola]KAI2150378.1 hypothetical protein LOZ27_000284 [Ophidiomyces ophidiicola]